MTEKEVEAPVVSKSEIKPGIPVCTAVSWWNDSIPGLEPEALV